jgi:hypothetical protein
MLTLFFLLKGEKGISELSLLPRLKSKKNVGGFCRAGGNICYVLQPSKR